MITSTELVVGALPACWWSAGWMVGHTNGESYFVLVWRASMSGVAPVSGAAALFSVSVLVRLRAFSQSSSWR